MKVDTVIKNGIIVKPDRTIEGWLAVEGGRIAMIGTGADFPEAHRIIDTHGNFVVPGLIDPHVHVDWPEWDFEEGTESTTKAAAAGGVTTIINHLSSPESLVGQFSKRKEAVEKCSYVDAAFHSAIYTEEHIEEIPEMASLGVPSFKFFLPYRGSEVVPPLVGIDDGIVYLGFQAIARLGYPGIALVHAENVEIFFRLKSHVMKEGREYETGWQDVRPVICESESIRRMAAFSKDTGCPVYIVHVSSEEGSDEIMKARKRGIRIVGETCPQYLTLTAQDVDRVLGKVNPPIRKERRHGEALWSALAEENGPIQCIGSDHAPCAKKHKQNLWDAYVGAAGIQTMLPVMLSEGVNRNRISIQKLVQVCSENAAKTFGLFPKKGSLEVGADADLVVSDLEKKITVDPRRLHHISDFSLFDGKTLTGCPVLTMVRGSVVMEEGEVVGKKGFGKFIPRRPVKMKKA